MYELVQVAENSFYIQSPAKIGIVKLHEKDVCLIDSGNDKDAGRKIRQILDANDWHLTAFIIHMRMRITSVATNICRSRLDARFMFQVLIVSLQSTRFWSPVFCMVDFHPRISDTNS